MKPFKFTLAAIALLIGSALGSEHASAQDGLPRISSAIIIGNPSYVYIAEVAKLNPDRSFDAGTLKPELFEIKLNYPRVTGREKPARLRIKFYKNGEFLTEGTSQPVPAPVTENERLTNNNINNSRFRLGGFSLDEDQMRKLVAGTEGSVGGISLPTALPAATYTFEVAFFNDDFTDTRIIPMTVTNPTGYVSLLAPGTAPASSVEEVLTFTPVFQWQSEGQSNAVTYKLRVWEALPAQRTYNEVVNNTPHFEQIVNGSSFQYPAANARALRAGYTYYWVIESDVTAWGRGDKNKVQSVPYVFRVAGAASTSDDATSAATRQKLTNELKELLRSKYNFNPDWLEKADFVSFSGNFGTGGADNQPLGSVANNTDVKTLVSQLKVRDYISPGDAGKK